MIIFPNAKINLGLSVVSKRPDGYHNLETVFYPLPIKDALEIIPSSNEKTTFFAHGLPIEGNPSENLVMKAYAMLAQEFALPPVEIHLYKNIPMGAGLGGGSSDGAFAIRLLNDLFELKLNENQMANRAEQLGADCPFFVSNHPTYAEGTGNLFTPVNLSLKGLYFLLIKPELHISTRQAFGGIIPHPPQHRVVDTIQLPIERWKEKLLNDFENSIFPIYPQLKELKESLYHLGARYASMSGSGSSIFGIFNHNPEQLIPLELREHYTTILVGQFD